MAWYEQSVKRNRTLDVFCGPAMTYEPIENFRYDAHIFNSKNKFIGIAKIFSQQGNYGSKPIVEINKDDLEWFYEIGLLTGKKPAAIVRFRNKIVYLRLEKLGYPEGIQRNKPTYKIPIGEFRICQQDTSGRSIA